MYPPRKLHMLGALLGATLMLAGTGCVEEEVSMLVVGNFLVDTDNSCDVAPDLEGPFLSRGQMDIFLTQRYLMFPTILNQLGVSDDVQLTTLLPTDNGLDEVSIESNTILLNGARVSYSSNVAAVDNVLRDRFIPIGTAIFPEQVSSVNLEVIDSQLGALLASNTAIFGNKGVIVTVLVTVQFEGRTSAGTDVKSSKFTFPLDICTGCLITYAPNSVVPVEEGSDELTCSTIRVQEFNAQLAASAGDVGFTPLAAEDPQPVCIFGQDAPVDCRLCRSSVRPDEADFLCDP